MRLDLNSLKTNEISSSIQYRRISHKTNLAAMKAASLAVSSFSAVLVGMLGLASAMGIGRFALTPVMPFMLHDAGLSMSQGSWLATANYIGYLAGALLCIAVPPRPTAAVRWGLVLVAATTLAMGLSGREFLWIAFRFMAGAASAMVLVGVSAWAMPVLKRHGKEQWSGRVFAGVGLGISLTGLLCLGAGIVAWTSQSTWLLLGCIAAVLALLLWRPLLADETFNAEPVSKECLGRANLIAAACYSAFGYGYIIPATFLPAIARRYIDNPAIFGLVWPVFGVASAISTLVAASLVHRVSPRRMWIGAQWFLAIGVSVPLLGVNMTTLTVAAVCVGGSFMVITMAGISEALRLTLGHRAQAVGLMTSGFAVGQIAGPVAVNMFPQTGGFPIVPSLIAVGALVMSNLVLISGNRGPS